MKYQCTEERFLKDVENHVMTVIRDNGVDRHIRFRQPDTICYYFDLITWAGNLCITGDCGTYVFQRLEDMFEFFRKDHKHKDGETLFINPHYWAEKVVSISRNGGIEEWAKEKFSAAIKEYFDNHFKDEIEEEAQIRADAVDDPISPAEEAEFKALAEKRAELWAEIENEILCYADDQHQASHAAYHFEHAGFQFIDFFERNFQQCTFHFIWNLYAIAYGIQKYDEYKAPVAAEQQVAQPQENP